MESNRDNSVEQYDGHGHAHEADGHLQRHPLQGDFTSHPPRPGREQLSHIKGWGVDLDRKNRPGVPMERTPPRFIHQHEGKLPQQPENVEVLVSCERSGITPVFGTVQPPQGMSGALRRLAFKWSESDMRHWLLLLLADRVNVAEGIGEDLAGGKVPNVLGEMGIKAEWQYNKAGLAKKALVAGALVGSAVYLMRRRDR